jgi:hypothetical protein
MLQGGKKVVSWCVYTVGLAALGLGRSEDRKEEITYSAARVQIVVVGALVHPLPSI